MAARSDPAAAAPFPPLGSAFTVAALGFLAWGITTEAHLGLGGSHLAALLLLVAACAGWLGWAVVRSSERGERASAAITIGVMAAAGGALVPFAPLAVTFVGVAALGATIGWAMRTAGWVIAAGLAAMLVSVPAAGHSLGILSLGFGVALAGAAMGLSRRQSQERAAQAVLLSVERERADIEQARAELLADRNHLAPRASRRARSHSCGSLDPARGPRCNGARRCCMPLDPEIVQQVERTKRLVREGLAEARNAVRALRDDLEPLPDQLAKLAADQQSSFAVVGEARALSPQVTLALYRAAQEGLTNAMKHAPGAATGIELTFGPEHVTVTVTNGPPGADATREGPLATRVQRQRLRADRDRGAAAVARRRHGGGPE